MKTDISVLFEVPEKAYKILEMISKQSNSVDLYCMGGNEILLAGSLLDLEDGDEEEGNWEDIEDFEDFPF